MKVGQLGGLKVAHADALDKPEVHRLGKALAQCICAPQVRERKVQLVV